MKAFILDDYGSADCVRAGEMPEPELREDDVLVQIHAAGVNQLDSKIRNGEFKVLAQRLPNGDLIIYPDSGHHDCHERRHDDPVLLLTLIDRCRLQPA